MRFLLRLFLILLFILLIGFLVGGFFWWLSGGTISGANQPEDLGVEYDDIDLEAARRKAGIETLESNLADSYLGTISYEGSHFVNTVFTQRELNALVNSGAWKYYPLKSVQIKINRDNSFEASGLILTERLGGYIEATGEVDNLATRVIKLLGYNKQNIPFYIQGFISIKDNEPDWRFQKVKLGPFFIPLALIGGNSTAINDFLKRQLLFVQGLSIESLEIKDGELKLVGTLPDTERIVVY